ncbi:hypothetical protein KCH_33540 [Kitasatospora cheerisanensis KCTC 2395]|uniref:Uncharacterized protein n=1 Tax=Kitasatospora cheerisanensis KCTC 2395 TaxID=1348663 RepID=A0A066YUC3_9ACTN|nr:hypothetical protein KCH_33540 [Kitasatospora cheerisanensis KCTC 2395]
MEMGLREAPDITQTIHSPILPQNRPKQEPPPAHRPKG